MGMGEAIENHLSQRNQIIIQNNKNCQTCLHYKPSSFTLLGGVLKQYIWLELEMLVVQTYTAESGVCSTCFVTALYWNKDCCIRNKETSFFLQLRSEEHTSALQSHLNLVC